MARQTPLMESFEEHGTIHADDEMDKENREDYEVTVKKELDPECLRDSLGHGRLRAHPEDGDRQTYDKDDHINYRAQTD